jgi:hypothetical protein
MKKLSSMLMDNALVRFFTRGSKNQYRPERYYMRGPGPKSNKKSNDMPLDTVPASKTVTAVRD